MFRSRLSFLPAHLRSMIPLLFSLLLAVSALWLPVGGVYAGGAVQYSATPPPGSTINTGSAVVGQTTSAVTVTISETSATGGFNVTHSVSGPQATDFSVTPASLTVVFGQPKTLTITCTPSAGGTRTAILTVNVVDTSSNFNSFTYPLTCNGTNPPAPGYSSTPAPGSTIDAGSAVIGQPTSAALTISETGNATLNITSVAVTGTNASDFNVTPTTLTIADGGASQNLTITCTPTASGTRTATLTVNHNAPTPANATRGITPGGGSATYTLTCLGTTVSTPGYGSNPAPGSTISLGTVSLGQTSTAALTISETGDATLNVTSIALSGANATNFTASPTTLSIANGGASQDVTITCTPSAAGTRTATLTVNYVAPGSTATYSLTCVGTTNPAPGYGSKPAPGSTINVGSAVVSQSITSTLTISETGNATLNVTSIALSGANATDFKATPSNLTIADGGASQNVTITCTPSAVGTRTATLTVTHNADGIPATYTLTCAGIPAPAPGYDSTPAPGSTLNVGSAVIGGSVSAPLVIREIGNAALQITSISLSGANTADFSVTPAMLTIPDGGSAQNVVVRCTPSNVGTRTATMTINHNAAGSPATYTLVCSATAAQQKVYVPVVMKP